MEGAYIAQSGQLTVHHLTGRDAASSRASESGSSGRMAWAFTDPEHGSGSASSGGTTTLTTPDSGRVSACPVEMAQAPLPTL